MDIAYSINEKYVNYCLVSICSLLKNNKASLVRIHILYDDLSADAISRITHFVTQRGGEIQFHKIDDSAVAGLILQHWPKSAWYRIFLPTILDKKVHRVLYLDSDTVVSGPISDLFEIDMSDKSLAGCLDIITLQDEVFSRLNYPRDKGYICSGVLLMNLDYFRANNLSKSILDFARSNSDILVHPDQDAINYVCRDSKMLLPLKYETMDSYFRNEQFVAANKKDFAGMIEDPRIIHYAGCPPWFIETNTHIYSNLFWSYASEVGGVKLLHFSKGITILKNIVKFGLGKMGVNRYSAHCKINLKRFVRHHGITLKKTK